MRYCQFRSDGSRMVCSTCGRRVLDRGQKRVIAMCGMYHRGRFVAVGDLVARVLEAIGISKQRVSSVVGKDCGCRGRQAAWNQFGFIAQFKMHRAMAYAEALLFGDPRKDAANAQGPQRQD